MASPVLHSARCHRVRQRLVTRMQNRAFSLGIFMEEVWRDIPGYEGRYQVSDHGRVKGVKGILSPNVMANRYLCVHLYSGGKDNRKVFTVHKLVASVFLVKTAEEINHINFDVTDNSVHNLEWVTHANNVRHTIAAGRNADIRKPVVATSIHTGQKILFSGRKEAEVLLRGRQTGRVSQSLKNGRPAYGFLWGVA